MSQATFWRAALAAMAVSLCESAAADTPTHFPEMGPNSIDIEIGGVVSGPYRLCVDLDQQFTLEGRLLDGRFGDGAGVSTRSLPVTARVSLLNAEAATLRTLADAMLAHGAETHEPCEATVDRIVVLAVSRAGRSWSGTLYCPTQEVTALTDEMFKSARRLSR